MNFLNFRLQHSAGEVVVQAHGLAWDLHNLAEYSGMTIDADGTARLEWKVFPNPYRPDDPVFNNCAFVFHGLSCLKIKGRDPEMPKSEDTTLNGISRVLPDDSTPYLTKQKEWPSETSFHLLFEFMGGISIEIGADEAEFVKGKPRIEQ